MVCYYYVTVLGNVTREGGMSTRWVITGGHFTDNNNKKHHRQQQQKTSH